jgi:hypothetical protein
MSWPEALPALQLSDARSLSRCHQKFKALRGILNAAVRKKRSASDGRDRCSCRYNLLCND